MTRSRRRLLRGAAGAAALGLAGCLDATDGLGGGGSPVASRTTTTRRTRTTTAHGDCAGYDPLPETFDVVEYDSLDGFDLAVEPATVAVDGAFAVRLRNASDGEAMTGNRRKFDVQRDTGDGWHSVYRVEEHTFWTDEGVPHQSGTGFTWELAATRDGLTPPDSAYRVCDPVRPGSFRFVYWGISPPAEEESDFETEYAVGARFEIEP